MKLKHVECFGVLFALLAALWPATLHAASPTPVLLMIHNAASGNADTFDGIADRTLREDNEQSFREQLKIISPEVEILPVDVTQLEQVVETVLPKLTPDKIVVGAFIFGHGSPTRYSLDSKTRYNGAKLAEIAGQWLAGLPTSKVFTLLFKSCELGHVTAAGTDGFSESFTQTLKKSSLGSTEVHVLTYPLPTTADGVRPAGIVETRMISLVNHQNFQRWSKATEGKLALRVMTAAVVVTATQLIFAVTHGTAAMDALTAVVKELAVSGSLAGLVNMVVSFYPKLIRQHVVTQNGVVKDELGSANQKITEAFQASVASSQCEALMLGED